MAVLGCWGSCLGPCQDHTLPGIWEDSGCILYHPWGWFHERFFGQSAVPHGSPSCASGEQQPAGPAQQLGGLWQKYPADLRKTSLSRPERGEEPRSLPAFREELAGGAGLGGEFPSVGKDFQALRMSRGKLLGQAPQCTRGNAWSWKLLRYCL